MSARKDPSREAFLPLFVGDFLAATGEWEGEAQALYLLLLSHQWVLGSLPPQESALVRLTKYDRKRFAALWETVGTKFDEVDGRLKNLRLEQHRQHSHSVSRTRQQAGRRGAAARWGGDEGGGEADGKCHEFANGNGMANASGLPMANGSQLPDFCHAINQSINQSSNPELKNRWSKEGTERYLQGSDGWDGSFSDLEADRG